MGRLVGALLVMAFVLGACGGSTSADSGGGGGGGAAPVSADLPRGQSILFGSSFDPATLQVTGKGTKFKQGSPIVAVARTLTPRPMSEVSVVVLSPGQSAKPRPVTAAVSPDNGDLFAIDLTGDNLGPGTWTVNFVNPGGRILASAFLTVTP